MCDEKKSGGGGKWRHPVSLVFRITGMGLAVAAAAVMATASECTVYADYYGARPRTVAYRDFPAFVYLVVAASIAAALEAVAIFLCVCGRKGAGRKAGAVLAPLLAATAPALLYTSAGAAFAAGWDIYYYLLLRGAQRAAPQRLRQQRRQPLLRAGARVHVALAQRRRGRVARRVGGGGAGVPRRLRLRLLLGLGLGL